MAGGKKRQEPVGIGLGAREAGKSKNRRTKNLRGHESESKRKKRGSLTAQTHFGRRQWPGASQPQPQNTSETPRASRRVWLAWSSERAIHPISTQRAKAK